MPAVSLPGPAAAPPTPIASLTAEPAPLGLGPVDGPFDDLEVDRGTLVPNRPPSMIEGTEGPGSPPLDDALTATIRRWARPTTPKELEERGVKRVRSVSMSRMASLIEKAVNKVLIARTLDGGSEEALTLSSSARNEFLRLARGEMHGRDDDLRKNRATSTLDRLRRELADRRRELADRETELASESAAPDDDSGLQERLREIFAVHSSGGDRELENETMSVVLAEVSAVRKRAREEQLAESMREINQLERRISKLSVLLGETEEELRRMRARSTIDPGIESIYDAVQGLDSGDHCFEQKADLMKCIFEANLALRN